MGMYFPMSNNQIQRDAATMLYLREPLPSSHSETPVLPGNMTMYMNFASSSGPYSDALAGNSQSVNVQPVASDSNTSQQELLLQFGGSRAVENQLMHRQGESSGILQDATNDISPYGMPSIARAVPNSKYLKAAQQLLDEVVNVKKAIKEQNPKKELMKEPKEVEGEFGDRDSDPSAAVASSVAPKAIGNPPNELSVAERQELQNKITKLLSMLDEVDRRYRQYYHQMQIVVSSFDLVAGSGAAKPYTALALQTISRHFRCLRDAINGQILVARKNLGEEDASSNDKGIGISRLRYVDQQLRQQRALQQLGMIQQHSWRPQRGLPETSVLILRAWLFEHFLHPYPKDSDKIMLARQTGLTRSQVSNWFINARVRLWKPMVEEMYKEEIGDADIDSNSSSETIPRATKTGRKASEDKGEDVHQTATSTGRLMESKSDQMTDVQMMGSDTYSIYQNVIRAEPQINYGVGKTREELKQTNDSNPFPDSMVDSDCGNDSRMLAAYQMSELERFGNVSGVSLTLGLQQCEGGRGFVPLRDTDVYNTAASAMGNETAEFDCMDSGNRPHQLVSSLLPSFT
ncbi:UNVERIFIED_CONTAM: BEL1-like homeodomain protein 7 [Sesamum radiatum]|uniref:BEL1-like homeodomain protein 7 n=1 Tax=Sesamum radiatum TaxID=300843 RepID=A0AAW2RUU3_SESRA